MSKMSDEFSFWGQDAGKLVNGIGFPIAIGIVATFVRMNRFGVRYSWAQWVTAILTSSFIAVLTYWSLDYLDLQPTVDAAIVGVASYMGTSILDAFMSRVRW